jgi:hypothetical protein
VSVEDIVDRLTNYFRKYLIECVHEHNSRLSNKCRSKGYHSEF